MLVDSFQSFLGGTVVSHEKRLEWLDRQATEPTDPVRREILADCAAAGLRAHQSRFHGTRIDEAGVRDWHPRTQEDAVEVLRGSWRRLVQLVTNADGETREATFAKLVESVRIATDGGIADEV